MNGNRDGCTRTRLEIFLPCALPEEIAATLQVLNYIKDPNPSGRAPYTGYTHSTTQFPMYGGAWQDDTGKWVYDQLLLLFIDLPITCSSQREIHYEIDILKRIISGYYRDNGAPQSEIYVVPHPIF